MNYVANSLHVTCYGTTHRVILHLLELRTYTCGQIHSAMRVQHESLPLEVASLLKTHEKQVTVFRHSNKFSIVKATC